MFGRKLKDVCGRNLKETRLVFKTFLKKYSMVLSAFLQSIIFDSTGKLHWFVIQVSGLILCKGFSGTNFELSANTSSSVERFHI